MRAAGLAFAIIACFLVAVSPARAGGAWTVDTQGGGVGIADGRCDAEPDSVSENPCTLAEAVAESHNKPGPTFIGFNIDWSGALPITTNAFVDLPAGSVIDGTGQSGYQPGAPAIRISPSSFCPDCAGITTVGAPVLDSPPVLIKGVDITGFQDGVYADRVNVDVEDCKIELNGRDGVHIQAVGWNEIRRSRIYGNSRHGIHLLHSNNNIVKGNRIGRTDDSSIGNGQHGVYLEGGSSNTIGAAGDGNVISGNGLIGLFIETTTDSFGVNHADNNVVRGNRIGTDVNGVADFGNTTYGIWLYGNNNTIGGGNVASDIANVVSGNDQGGVYLAGSSSLGLNNTVEGNRIGTDVSGTAAVANRDGIVLATYSGVIGGTAAGAGNLISGNVNGVSAWSGSSTLQSNLIGTQIDGVSPLGNTGAGVRVASTHALEGNTIAFNGVGVQGLDPSGQPGSPDVTIGANSIFSNSGLGIDMGPSGITANDPAGSDDFRPQNYPVLQSVDSDTSSVTIRGHLHSNPSTQYTLRFYSSPACDSSGNGEGKVYLGSTLVTTAGPFSGQGDVDFTKTLPVAVQGGDAVTATAQAASPGPGVMAGTSEFSGCVVVHGVPPTITSVSPASGPTAGGTAVTLTGTGYNPGSRVFFGGTEGTVTGGSGTTQLRVTTPAHSAGAVDVRVLNGDGQSATLTNGYTYVAPPPPAPTGVNPASGPTTGGTAVAVTGTGFGPGSRVFFGTAEGTVTGGSGTTQLNVTTPAHSAGAVDVKVQNPDSQTGTLTGGFTFFDQTGYPRPKAATPLRVPLVPAYAECLSPNETHGPPLASRSCAPPAQESTAITVGTPDANGATANSIGFARFTVQRNTAPTPSDVLIDLSITDVRCQVGATTSCGSTNSSAGADYAGALEARTSLRLTDKFNATDPGGGTDSATVADAVTAFTVPCTQTAGTSIGSACATTTSANALAPGFVQTGKRALWELGQLAVIDGGDDGDPATGPNALFTRQGIFIP